MKIRASLFSTIWLFRLSRIGLFFLKIRGLVKWKTNTQKGKSLWELGLPQSAILGQQFWASVYKFGYRQLLQKGLLKTLLLLQRMHHRETSKKEEDNTSLLQPPKFQSTAAPEISSVTRLLPLEIFLSKTAQNSELSFTRIFHKIWIRMLALFILVFICIFFIFYWIRLHIKIILFLIKKMTKPTSTMSKVSVL